MTWPLASQLNSHVPTPDSDVFNVYWGNWWVRTALGSGRNPYFTDYLIYPEGFNLISFAFSPFLALLWIPLSWFLPPLAAYNLVFLVTIVLCAVAMDQLVRYLTGNAWAAMVAGITFAFAPSLVAERLPHLNLSALFWIPWAVLVLTRLMREARVRDAILLAAMVGLAFLTRLQVGVLVVLFTGVYFVGLALVDRKSWHRLALRRLVLAGLISLLLLTPLLLYAWQSLQQEGGADLLRGAADQYQTDLLAYVLPTPQNPLFGSWTVDIYGQKFAVNMQYWAYIGFVPLLLALYATVSRPRQALPWLLAGLTFFILALGPILRLNGEVYPAIKLPYSLATDLFSAIGLNWPNRFNLCLMVAVSALVGMACAHILSRPRRAWLVGLAALLILGEFLVVPLPTILAPPHSDFYDQMATDGEDYAIVDLPLTRADGEIHRYYQTIHQKPIVGGWDHRTPASAFDFIAANPLLAQWFEEDQSGVPLPVDTALAQLAEANVRYIVIHKDQVKGIPESVRGLVGILNPVYQDYSIIVLPVGSTSSEGYNVAQWFGRDLGLVEPVAFLHLPWDGRPPLLSLYICWIGDGQGDTADSYRVTLTGPNGAPSPAGTPPLGDVTVYDETTSLPDASQGLTCDTQYLELAAPLQNGEHILAITPLSEDQSLGTYTTSQPIHVLQTRDGTEFPAMGTSSPVAFDAPMELLGYNMVGGDGFVWVDLFWRSTAKHQGSYSLSVQLADPESGQCFAHVENVIPEHAWKEGDLYQERRFLWLNDVAPGRYPLSIALQGPPAPQPYAGEPTPGETAVLEVPLLVLPASAKGSEVPEPGWIIAYTLAE